MAIDHARIEQILAATAAMGSAESALSPILVSAAVRAIQTSGKDVDDIQKCFGELARRLNNAKSHSELQAILLSEDSVKYGLDELCRGEVAARRLVATLDGFRSVSFPDINSIDIGQLQALNNCDPKAVAWRLARGLAKAGSATDADVIVRTAFAALGKLTVHPVDLKAALKGLGKGKDALTGLIDGSISLPASAADAKLIMGPLIDAVAGSAVAQQVTAAEAAVQQAQSLATAVQDFKWSSASPSDSFKSINAAATSASGLLAALGNDEASEAVAKASGYLQSAAQIQQCAMLLINPAGGMGAALAIAGMAGGLGGLGAFGGAGGQDVGAQQHEQVMTAIANLQQRMLAEFGKVNERLEKMTVTLGEILEAVRAANLRLGTIQLAVSKMQDTLDVMLLWQEDRALDIIQEIQEGEGRKCRSEANEDAADGRPVLRGPGLSGCISFYSDVAGDAASDRGQIKAGPDTVNASNLRKVFGRYADNAPIHVVNEDRWRCMLVLKAMLESRAIALAGSPSNEPMLVGAVSGLTLLYGLLGRDTFMAIKDQKAVSSAFSVVRGVCLDHARFLDDLRRPETAIELTKIYSMELEAFLSGLEQLRTQCTDQLIKQIKAAASPYQIIQPMMFRNSETPTNVDYVLFANANTEPLKLLFTHVSGAPSEVQLRDAGSYSVKDQGGTRYIGVFDARILMDGDVVVDFVRLPDTRLLFDGCDYATLDALLAAQDVVGFLSKTNGSAGSTGHADIVAGNIKSLIANQQDKLIAHQKKCLSSIGAVDILVARTLLDDKMDWGEAKEKLQRLDEAWNAALLLKAVLQTGHETAYAQCDLLQSMLNGNSNYQLFNWDVIRTWASNQPNAPQSGSADLAALSRARYQQLTQLLEKFFIEASTSGPRLSLGFTAASDALSAMIKDY